MTDYKKSRVRVDGALPIKKARKPYDRENPPHLQILILEDGSLTFCLQYAGSGKYSSDLKELLRYADKRWGLELDEDFMQRLYEEATA